MRSGQVIDPNQGGARLQQRDEGWRYNDHAGPGHGYNIRAMHVARAMHMYMYVAGAQYG